MGVKQRSEKACVAGSIPAETTTKINTFSINISNFFLADCNLTALKCKK